MRIAFVGCGFVADYYYRSVELHDELELVGARRWRPEEPALERRHRAEAEPAGREAEALAHEVGGCDGYSRADFIVPAAGDPVLLEVNTLPGLTERSLLPQEAAAEGTSYRDLRLFILDRALARRSPA